MDGLVRATDNPDNAPDWSAAFFAQIRPANPGSGAWSVGYVKPRYLVMVSLFDTHAYIYGIISKSAPPPTPPGAVGPVAVSRPRLSPQTVTNQQRGFHHNSFLFVFFSGCAVYVYI